MSDREVLKKYRKEKQKKDDEFLKCNNCIRWGQPWKEGRFTVVCSDYKDPNGKGAKYTGDSKACDQFSPIVNKLPERLQQLRLLVQTLNKEERAYLDFANTQAKAILTQDYQDDVPIAMGDVVKFEFDKKYYFGSVEGLDVASDTIIISCPAFPNTSITKPAATIEQITDKEALTLVQSLLSENEVKTLKFNKLCYAEEITELTSREGSAKEYRALLDYQLQQETIDSRLRFNQALGTLLS